MKEKIEITDLKRYDLVQTGELVYNRYQIMCKLHVGGFGQIYKAYDNRKGREVALKLEPLEDNQPNIEAIVLTKFSVSPHCPKIYSTGRTKPYVFVAMELLGKNLTELRKQCSLNPPRLSCSSTLRLMIQCIQAIESLHSVGFLHRDIKPSNFVVGNWFQMDKRLYLLDFGLARYFRKQDGSVLQPRKDIGFRGTVRYASLNSHDGLELSRRDDLWSFFYSYFELLIGELPWMLSNERQFVARTKRIYTLESLSQWLPEETSHIADMIHELQYETKPDYNWMIECFKACLKRMNVNEYDYYDWHVNDCGKSFRHWTILEDCKLKQ